SLQTELQPIGDENRDLIGAWLPACERDALTGRRPELRMVGIRAQRPHADDRSILDPEDVATAGADGRHRDAFVHRHPRADAVFAEDRPGDGPAIVQIDARNRDARRPVPTDGQELATVRDTGDLANGSRWLVHDAQCGEGARSLRGARAV